MPGDRIDSLLEEALVTGAIPADATAAERTEVQEALRAAGLLRATASPVRNEASGSMPVARARFERFVAQQQAPAPAQAAPRASWLSRFLAAPRLAAVGAVAAVLVVVAAVAIVGPNFTGDGVELAAALTPGDYAQVHGVVEEVIGEGAERELVLSCEVGELRIAINETTFVDETADPQPGDRLLVGGVVGERGNRIVASTVASGRDDIPPPPRERPPLERLERFQEGLAGRVVSFALSEDGQSANVVLSTRNGEHIVVPINPATAQRLLQAGMVVGTEVRVARGPDSGNVFTLEFEGGTPEPRPTALHFRGRITAAGEDTLSIQTDRAQVRVLVTPRTIILAGESGLTREQIRAGEGLVGLGVAVAAHGGMRPNAPLVADAIGVGEPLVP